MLCVILDKQFMSYNSFKFWLLNFDFQSTEWKLFSPELNQIVLKWGDKTVLRYYCNFMKTSCHTDVLFDQANQENFI